MKKLALFASLAFASMSFGQIAAPGWIQPWTPNLSAFESRVFSCGDALPNSVIAMDDFSFGTPVTVSNINWWGTLTQPINDVAGMFYIAIYQDAGCFPALDRRLVWSACYTPGWKDAGVDCFGQPVYKFFSTHAPITLQPGRYWLQISENDKVSPRPGRPDFGWSAHAPIVKCAALQLNAFGGVTQPLIEQCRGREVDLAFEVY